MTPGYWHANYYCTDYWHEDYWMDYGAGGPPAGGRRFGWWIFWGGR